MNTTIIIVLAALILIVVIAIIVILIKGKSGDEDTSQESSPMTFQEEVSTEQPEEPEMVSPQLHTPTVTPTAEPATIDDLTTPQQTASVEPDISTPMEEERPNIEESLDQPIQPTTPIQQEPVQQGTVQQGPNPLPDSSKINEDLANLQGTSNTNSDMDNLANTINDATQTENNQVAQVAPSIETTDEVTPVIEDTMNVQDQGYNPPQPQPQPQPQDIPTTEDIQNQGYNPPPPQNNPVTP